MSSLLDICIISSLHPSMNPRVVKDADALTAAGYTVGLIAPDFSAWASEADKEFADRPWRILERPQFGPLAPRSVRLRELARRAVAGIATKHLGVSHPSLVRAAHHPSAPILFESAQKHRARLYMAHYVAALPAAARAAEVHRALYSFDAEDFHSGDLADTPENADANRLIHAIESRFLPGCVFTTAAAPGIADAYASTYGIPRPTVVLNTFPRVRAPATWTARGSATPGPSIYWFSQTIGGDRGLQAAVRAIALSKVRPHLYLRGQPTVGVVEELSAIASEAGVGERLHFLPLAQPSEMEVLASIYDVGLCGELGHTRNRDIALTNKQFTYLIAGIPVLMSDISAHRDFSKSAEGAVELFRADDPLRLAAAIDATLGDAERLARMRRTAWELGQSKFNAEAEADRLKSLVADVFKPFRTMGLHA